MLRALRVVALEAFLLLRRDKIFVPAVVIGVLVAAFANLASDWSIEDFGKILFDLGYFGFHTAGSLVAIFWGAKAVTDSRQEGALEVQLAAPIGRSTWITGKYLGMVLALLLYAVILLAIWQGLMLANDFGLMSRPQLAAFGFMTLSWLVAAALATLFASFCRQAVAMFATLSLWVVGLMSSLVAHALAPDTPQATKTFVNTVARLWDFQQFNLIAQASSGTMLAKTELWWRAGYGGLLILALITVACVIFERRDAIL
jgi:ABC-type transport system involved in multi-copper enzyme maturation permease subunit